MYGLGKVTNIGYSVYYWFCTLLEDVYCLVGSGKYGWLHDGIT